MSKDHVAGLAIQIPEEMLRSAILLEIAKAMPDKEAIVRAVVAQAVSAKQNSYDKKTIVETRIEAEIRKMVETVFKEWLTQNTEAIRDALVAELNRTKQKRLKQLVECMVDGFSKTYVASVNLRFPSDSD